MTALPKDGESTGAPAWLPAVERLLAQPQGFDLFQAVSLLERAAAGAAVPVGRARGPLEREAVRLRSHPSLGFEPSDVRAVDGPAATGEPFTLTTPVLGLAGANGPLPVAFTELVLERQARRDHATADFVDIFNHRLLAFLYRGRAKHQPALHAGAPAQSALAATIDASSALGLRAGERAPDGSALWLRHAGLLGGTPRSMAGLLVLLRERLGTTVRGRQFAGGWRELDAADTPALGARAGGPRLGRGAVLGRRVWDQGAGIRLGFDGLDRPRLDALLPGGTDHALAGWLVRRYLPQDLDVQLELTLGAGEPRGILLGRAQPARLGWTSWLAGPAHRGSLPAVRTTLARSPAAA
ncbi:type VI secretion system baseplate subunit TssG [Xylophilus sp.]|uniref:type VI secretion system baseplate subunit TssG n=1 Tax=Xylophilus sp. TaxID=2653893 RepID=UPI0013B9EAF1|nr:type VI secretion system baseplate subunit TssG [Xylophilus sp.]KAF1045357.1 MAG: hypothetical protein GAK38_03069 [Xylophilus sp.]